VHGGTTAAQPAADQAKSNGSSPGFRRGGGTGVAWYGLICVLAGTVPARWFPRKFSWPWDRPAPGAAPRLGEGPAGLSRLPGPTIPPRVVGQGIEVPGLGALNVGGNAQVTSVLCASAGSGAADALR
jgi:hypothetical protein